MASCGIAEMIVSVGLLCADDFDDYVWHGCDHRVIIVVGFLRDCCEIMCDCCGLAVVLLRHRSVLLLSCCGPVLYLCGKTFCCGIA